MPRVIFGRLLFEPEPLHFGQTSRSQTTRDSTRSTLIDFFATETPLLMPLGDGAEKPEDEGDHDDRRYEQESEIVSTFGSRLRLIPERSADFSDMG